MKNLAYDTETTGLKPYRGHHMFAYSTCDKNRKSDVRRLDGSKVRQVQNKKRLEKLWSNYDITKVMHKARFDLTMTGHELGRDVTDHPFHDTMVQSHILQSNHPGNGLKDLTWELMAYPKDDESAVRAIVKEGGDYSHVPERLMDIYQERDAERTILLHLFFYPKIKANPQYMEIYQTELDLIRATIPMERRGVMLNFKKCQELIDELGVKVKHVAKKLERVAGKKINPNAPAQVRYLLFEKMGLPVLARTRKTKKPKTSKEVLAELKELTNHPALDLIAQYKSWSRGITTLKKYISLAKEDGTLNPDINTFNTGTAREAMSNPNLQNVSKEGVLLNPYPIPARRAFRPRPGYVNFHVDYSGIEMRLLIFYSRDPKLLKILRDGGNVHEFAAQIFYGKEFRSKERDETLYGGAKNANFAIPYGAGADKVATILGMSKEKGHARYAYYKEMLPGLVNLSPTITRMVKEQGYIDTTFGRRLRLPRSKGYMGTNYLIQGTAAGILKRAQVRVHNYLQDATGGEVQMLLPIHDEIVIEYPRKRLSEAKHIFRNIRELMIDFPMFDLPLEVDIEVATHNWADKSKFDIGG